MIKDIINNLLLNNTKLKPEIEKGNIEYKLRLDTKDTLGLKKTATQLLWRLNEGKQLYNIYEAYYIFGIKDNGEFGNISNRELNDTLVNFKYILKENNCKIIDQIKLNINNNTIYVTKITKINSIIKTETNIILIGPTNSGKSTLLSLLLYDQLDNGNGYSRNLVLTHEHEKISGKTSSLKRDFIGFKDNNLINYTFGLGISIEDNYLLSDRYMIITDTPGDKKYIKTLLHGISSTNHNIYIFCIQSDMIIDYIENNKCFFINIVRMCNVLNKQMIILLTKIDTINKINNTNYVKNINYLSNILKSLDINISINELKEDTNNINFNKNIYYLEISCISNVGINILINYFNNITKNSIYIKDSNKLLFNTNEVYNIPDTGIIIYGNLQYGRININDEVILFYNGEYIKKKVKNIYKKLLKADFLTTNETGCLQFYNLNINIDKTCIIINDYMKQFIRNKIIFIPLYNNPKNKNYTLFCGSIIQQVKLYINEYIIIESINKKSMLMQEKSIIILKDNNNDIFIGKCKFIQ